MAGLAHQMVWTRRLVDLLGASPLTFSKVVGAFFVGLAAGSALAVFYSGAARRPWRKLADAEALIAILAIPSMLTPYFPPAGFVTSALPFLLVTPPALVMGLVLPWLIRALRATDGTGEVRVTWLYAVNTFGGAAGVVLVLLVALPKWGLANTALACCAINFLVAAGAMLIGRRSGTASNGDVFEVVGGGSGLERSAIWLAFASGFLVLALEVLFQHQFAQVTINSLFSSGTVLVWALLSLAAGSAAAGWFGKRFRSGADAAALALAGFFCVFEPVVFCWIRPGLAILPYELKPGAYTVEISLLSLGVLFPVFFAAGMVFPLQLRKANGAKEIAQLLAWNGVGGWLGSELAQTFIAPRFGLWNSVLTLGCGYFFLSFLVVPRSLKWRLLFPFATASAAFIAAYQSAKLPQASLNSGERVAKLQVGREGVVATVECGPGDWRMLFNNSYTLGGSKAQSNQERQAHLPILLHGQAKSVALLGVATGGTLGGASLHPSLERIEAAELSPLVVEQAQQFFAQYNRNVFRDSRVRVMTEDARRLMNIRTNVYDVVIGDLFLPWRTGEARLFSLEHFKAVRGALKEDGIFCQWLPMFQLTKPQFETIARTFQEVFPETILLRGDFYADLPILGLMGGRRLEGLSWQQIRARCAELRGAGIVKDPIARHAEGVAMMIVGTLPTFEHGPINTLASSWLEWDCGGNILGMQTPWFVGIPEAEFLRGIHRAASPRMPGEIRAAHDAGQFFLTMEIAAKLGLPVLVNLKSQVTERLPRALQTDLDAAWARWPSQVKP